MNTSFLSSLAGALLNATIGSNGKSTLPDWLVTQLAVAAGSDSEQQAMDNGWIDDTLIRKAIGLYRAATARSSEPAAATWQFSANGLQAVQVLPPAEDSSHESAFLNLSRRVESVTLNHPRLAPVRQAAVQQGYPYLAARIGEGFQSLTRRFKLPLEDPRQAMRVVEQVSSALEYAHYRGMFHGSFDLHDILVNEQGQVRLLGVGLAQLRSRLNEHAAQIITPLLPPEVETGQEFPNASSDVFAVAALMYILLKGRVPAAGQQIALSQSIATVPAALDVVLTKALAENPAERYPSLVEMNRDLRVALRAPRAVTRPSKPAQPHAAPVASAASAGSVRRTAAKAAAPTPSARPDGFPPQLPMPEIDFSALEQTLLMPEVEALVPVEIPKPPEIPRIDWMEMLKPVDLSQFAGETIALPYAAVETLAPDPLVAAAMAVTSTEQSIQNRQRAMRKTAAPAARPDKSALDVPVVKKQQPVNEPPAGRARPAPRPQPQSRPRRRSSDNKP